MDIKNDFRRSLFVAFLVLLAGGLGACQKETGVSQTDEGQLVLGPAQRTATLERSVALAGRALVLDGFNGSVTLTGGDVETASLVFTKQARGRDAANAADVLGRITLEEAGDEATYRYVLRARNLELSRVDVQGTVPRDAVLRIQLGSGDVRLDGIDGPLTVQLDGGSVAIAGAGESVAVETRNGSIDVGAYRLAAGSAVRLQTTNGNLSLTVPGSVAARVAAQTSAGAITTEGLTFSDRRLNPEGAGARFRGQLGAGGAVVDLRTENGAIALREGSGTMLPMASEEAEADTTAAPQDTTAAPSDTTAPPPVILPDTTVAPSPAPAAPAAADTTGAS